MSFPFTGGGDSLSFGFPAGGGDALPLFGLGAGNYLDRVISSIPFILTSSYDFGPAQMDDLAVVVGEEGGYFLELATPIANYFSIDPDPVRGGIPHLVQLLDADEQVWPLLAPGCYGGVPTLAYVLIPRADGRVLRFASPQAPEGIYSVRVSRPTEGWSVTIPGVQVRVIPAPFSREVNTVRAAFPIEVYNPYPD
jgi:hypothetical protein